MVKPSRKVCLVEKKILPSLSFFNGIWKWVLNTAFSKQQQQQQQQQNLWRL